MKLGRCSDIYSPDLAWYFRQADSALGFRSYSGEQIDAAVKANGEKPWQPPSRAPGPDDEHERELRGWTRRPGLQAPITMAAAAMGVDPWVDTLAEELTDWRACVGCDGSACPRCGGARCTPWITARPIQRTFENYDDEPATDGDERAFRRARRIWRALKQITDGQRALLIARYHDTRAFAYWPLASVCAGRILEFLRIAHASYRRASRAEAIAELAALAERHGPRYADG